MSITISILQRVLVNHFYKVNSGLFAFLFFILFGLPQQPYGFHLALIKGILESQAFLALVMALWFLYNLKCLDYITRQLKDEKLTFLFCLNSFSFRKRLTYLIYVQLFVYLPVLIYACAIIFIAIQQAKWIYVFEIVAFNLALILFSALINVNVLGKKTVLSGIKLPSVTIHYPKPFFLIPLLHLWFTKKQMLLVTKIFSLLILWLFMLTYEPIKYDIRPLMLCMLLSVIAHTAIVLQLKAFFDEYLSFSKNLPINLQHRFTSLVLAFVILLLPEFIFLWKGYGIHFTGQDYPQIVLTSIALLCFFYATLMIEQTNMEKFLPTLFGVSTASFFILLYNPGLLFGVGVMILAYALFASYIYHYEEKIEKLN